ncbi:MULTISPECIES: transglycosylase SLT domain-containing protein [unclassified Streptomyces]|uniref:aggregation-promoting factor C-terminal-like domain-containing protein n=1 Tax=unclassified Streptomyces TaxID=2593676 RepID=UPI002E2A5F8D|nr:transglycosylase SLT domain-containing protein [Streptomyces sp. NBC_00285]
MSRPKLPDIPWRTFRIAAAVATAVLLTTASLVAPADAKPDGPTPQPVLTPSMTNLDLLLVDGHLKVTEALQHQAAAQADAHRQAAAEAAAKRRAEKAKAAAEHRAQAKAAAERRAAAKAAAEATRPSTPPRTSRSQSRTLPAQTATVSSAQSFARSRLSSAQYSCLRKVVDHESGWNHLAVNSSSGAYGLFQALPGSKMASAGTDWRTNPLTQMRWGLSYMSNRYGSPCGAWYFWQKNGWY